MLRSGAKRRVSKHMAAGTLGDCRDKPAFTHAHYQLALLVFGVRPTHKPGMDTTHVYILQCADGSYYLGLTRRYLSQRLAEHNLGIVRGYTKQRRPVQLAYAQTFERIVDAIAAERQLKGWSRAKKAALIRGEFSLIRRLAKRRT